MGVTGYNATLKQGYGLTDTALSLCARDYKGLSGSAQPMTAAAHLVPGNEQSTFIEITPDVKIYAVWYPKKQCYIAIRKLTPKECFRLQGWTDDYFEKAEFVNSNSQLYKQAGNGVVVNVVREIAKKMELKKESTNGTNY